MPDTIQPVISMGTTLTGLPTQDPTLEGLAPGLPNANDLKSSLQKSFEQSLRDSLERNQDPDQAVIVLTLQPSDTLPMLALPLTWQSGKLLPQPEGASGKGLPLGQGPGPSGTQMQPFTGLFNPIQNAETPLMTQFDLSQAAQVKVSEEIKGLTETLQITGEARTAGGQVGQYAAIGSHTEFTSTTSPRTGTLPALTVDVPVGQPHWDRAVGERIQWMLGKNIQEAEVKLNPPHLGPLEVRISMQNDQANVHFLASQASTREALEAALPRLREMFSDANLSLINVNVGQRDGSGQNSTQGGGYSGHVGSQGMGSDEQTATPGHAPIRLGSNGMVDDYA